jgi:hypothetical protein
LSDSSTPLLETDTTAGGPREDRDATASAVMWTTQGPVDKHDPSQTPLPKVGTAASDGTVFRVVRHAVRVAARHHRTDSVSYSVVMTGSTARERDIENVRLNAEDALIQQVTIHNPVDNSTKRWSAP